MYASARLVPWAKMATVFFYEMQTTSYDCVVDGSSNAYGEFVGPAYVYVLEYLVSYILRV